MQGESGTELSRPADDHHFDILVDPSISRHYRPASDHDTRTDRTDLEAGLLRAAINGLGLHGAPRDPTHAALQFWARHRRDLVHRDTLLRAPEIGASSAPGIAARGAT